MKITIDPSRNRPERRIEITKEPHPTKAGRWIPSYSIHYGDDAEIEIVLPNPDEAMTPEAIWSKAVELARSKGIEEGSIF